MSNKTPIHYPVSLQLQQLYCMDDDDDDDDDNDDDGDDDDSWFIFLSYSIVV